MITEEYLEPIHQDSGSGDIILKYKKPQSLTASKIDTLGQFELNNRTTTIMYMNVLSLRKNIYV